MVNRLFAGASLLLFAMAAQAQVQARSPGPLQRDEIVVVGAKLSDLTADLERCETGGCSVREDVIATVRYAEAQFRSGNYHDARTALGKSVSRTKKHADSDPFAFAELQTARATVAWHFGDQREALRATVATKRILDKHAPQSSNALMARMRLISAQTQNFRPVQTQDRLASLADDARDANLPLIAMRAELGQAAILHRRGRIDEASALLDAVMASEAPGSQGLRLAAQILEMRLAVRDRDPQAVEALIARLTEEQKGLGPVLVWSPEFPTPGSGSSPVNSPRGIDASGARITGLRWADIGFAVGPDGRVEDVEVLRGSYGPGWTAPLIKMIGQRRYTPSADPDDLTGRYRVERYTLTADFQVPAGSLIRRRAGRARFEQMDLTAAPPNPTASPASPS